MVKIDSINKQDKVIEISKNSLHIKPKEENNIYEFSQSVLDELNQNNIPSIPSNYSIYFDKLLDERGDVFKEKLGDALFFYNQETANNVKDGQINLEKEIKHSFGQIKSMLQAVALIYKNLSLMKNIARKHLEALQSNTDILATQNVISSFNDDLLKLSVLMDKHVDIIKINYEEIGKIFKTIEEQAVYDSVYDVYNKRFIISVLQSEIDSVKRYGYSSSFILIRPNTKTLINIQSLRDKSQMLKKMAMTLVKTSRQSDVVAHYGDGIFIIVMKHTDINGAKLACNRLSDLISKIRLDINGARIEVQTQMVASSLTKDKSMEEALSAALDTLEKTSTSKEPVILEDE